MKYKHKHTGQIVTKGTDGLYHSKEGGYTLQGWIFENSNDWEEVKPEYIGGPLVEVKEEPNYLITAFEGNKSGIKFQLQSNGRYKDSDIGAYFDKDFLLKNTTIFSIKNEFGKEFSIGDKVTGDNEEFVIESFELGSHTYGGCFVCGKNKLGKVKVSIKLLNVVKSPIYTTTDGKVIYEGDRVWLSLLHKDLSRHENDLVLVGNFSQKDKEVADRYLTFTSEENRDKYIKENSKKPVFVSADNVEFYDNNTDFGLFSVLPKANWQENRYRLNDIIKWTKKEWLHFHTKEARQEYVDNNKPKYSLVDVEKCYFEGRSRIGFIEELKKLDK